MTFLANLKRKMKGMMKIKGSKIVIPCPLNWGWIKKVIKRRMYIKNPIILKKRITDFINFIKRIISQRKEVNKYGII